VSSSTVAELFRDHHGELVRLAVLMVGDRPTAEDVVQDVYASLHSRPRQPDDPLPYVRAAVLNGCRSVLRRRGIARRATLVHRASQQPDEALASAESEVILSEDRRQVLAALARLPRRRREVLCLSALGPPASRTEQVRTVPVTAAAGSLARSTVLLGQDGTLPFISDAVAGPRPGERTLAVLAGRTAATGGRPVATVERVAARTGSVLGIDYRLVIGPYGETPQGVVLGVDPSGQHLLLTYGAPGGFRTGWISQGRLRPLPIRQPYPGPPIMAW
jgi:RNA polymerase sigma factor (sigma-70 family)